MDITINMPQEQIFLLATKMGYQTHVEDTTQPLDGDTYPLIENPVSLQEFTETLINQTLLDMILTRLRSEVKIFMDNEYNKISEKTLNGEFDAQIMTLDSEQLIQHILGEFING